MCDQRTRPYVAPTGSSAGDSNRIQHGRHICNRRLAGRDLEVMARGLWEGLDELKTPCGSASHRASQLE